MNDWEFLLLLVVIQWVGYGVIFYGDSKGWKWVHWRPGGGL